MVEFRTSGCTAFMGTKAIASGDLRDVALKAKSTIDRDRWAQVLIFDDVTSALVQVDFRGSAADVLRRIDDQAASATHASEPPQTGGETRRPGRPKLGVVAREVTLLPRHWDWLASQPGARRLHCASWWSRENGQTKARTASGVLKSRRIGSYLRWRETSRVLKRRSDPCSQASGNSSTRLSNRGLSMSGSIRRSWPPSHSRAQTDSLSIRKLAR
jgi:hypothetical protein